MAAVPPISRRGRSCAGPCRYRRSSHPPKHAAACCTHALCSWNGPRAAVLYHQRLLLTTPHDVLTMAPPIDPWSVQLALDMHNTDCCNYSFSMPCGVEFATDMNNAWYAHGLSIGCSNHHGRRCAPALPLCYQPLHPAAAAELRTARHHHRLRPSSAPLTAAAGCWIPVPNASASGGTAQLLLPKLSVYEWSTAVFHPDCECSD
jgi:hypothetical protein